jgi:hypothetical protein
MAINPQFGAVLRYLFEGGAAVSWMSARLVF